MTGPILEFHTDAGEFLASAGDWLSERPVESTVVATLAEREVRDAEAGIRPEATWPRWWLVVRAGAGAVVGAAMRTAPFEPHPPYVLAMPEQAALTLARALHERGERIDGVNGLLPTARLVAEETARLSGRTARVFEQVRLWEVGELTDPAGVPGSLRQARPDEAELVRDWYAVFGAEAAEQAGHDDPHPSDPGFDVAAARRRIEQGEVWFWEVDGEVVHVTNTKPPAQGVSCIGPVYTPRAHRGHGYATAAVAAATRRLLDDGHRVCLFTDVDNPVSNRIYAAIGYRPVADTANLLLHT
ncbi:GNAT family N-acetyltransferase [Nocardioides sp. CER19]|uniref:GNAT family N-acetyltransferase n=1 Tax=Nocardioides sp. CER19 TaxID=3038538 RepID=UPI0024484473|nr:GNAT family N-acetyltransferase [Nocardioides sp. CER19]MDH2414043.1 GNAT family N-acetyltransferase [Nocardioides sp. CER19]